MTSAYPQATGRAVRGVWCVLIAASLCCDGGASEKTTLSLPGKYKGYEIPAVFIDGRPLAIIMEKGDMYTYEPPFESLSSACALRIGRDAIAGGRNRVVKSYLDFCRIKMTVADDMQAVAAGAEKGESPFEKIRLVREDRTSLVYTSRWRDDGRDVFGVEAVVLAYDLPMRFLVMMRDREDAAREDALVKGLTDWADRVARANRRLPQEIDIILDTINVKVPFPDGYFHFYHGGSDSYGWFAPQPRPDANKLVAATDPVLDITRMPESLGGVAAPETLEPLRDSYLAMTKRDGGEAEIVAKGSRHFLACERVPGAPETYHNFVRVRGRLLILSFRGKTAGRDPASVLGEWRRETFINNGEAPE